jgi:L-cysteate sulfo-lyase
MISAEHIAANYDYVGQGSGIATQGMVEAVRLVAELDGILLDPVYSGKAMAGLIDLIRKGHFAPDSNIVFMHTGGSVGLFGYPEALH